MRYSKTIVSVIIAFLLLTCQVKAQTEEETVYFLMEQKEGISLDNNHSVISDTTKLIPSSASYNLKPTPSVSQHIVNTFKKVSKCVFEYRTHINNVSTADSQTFDYVNTLDLNKAYAIEWNSVLKSVVIKGQAGLYCNQMFSKATCSNQFWIPNRPGSNTDVQRVKAAWAYMRGSFCKGRAF